MCSTSPSAAFLRCGAEGLELVEVAPGIDIERDILALMDFKPLIPRDPLLMDARIFRDGVMDLRNDMLTIPLDQRFTFDEQQNLFFVNFERFAVRTSADIKAIEKAAEAKLAPLGRRVYAIVNYDNFSIPAGTARRILGDGALAHRPLLFGRLALYHRGFLRIKLGEALENRGVAPHIFESADEARSDWHKVEGTPG